MNEVTNSAPAPPFSWRSFFTKKRPRLNLIGKVFLIFFIAFYAVWFFYGSQCSLYLLTHYGFIAKSRQSMMVVPTPITDTTESAIGVKFQAFGLDLNLPCPAVNPIAQYRTIARIDCTSGLYGFLSKDSNRKIVQGILSDPKNGPITQRILGPEALSSDDALLRASLAVKPSDNSLRLNRAQATRLFMLNMFKSSEVLEGVQEIHSVANSEFHGFEFRSPKSVRLMLFDTAGHEVEILLMQKNQQISQPDINKIFHTIHSIESTKFSSNG